MGAERVVLVLGPLEEAKDEMGIVFELEGDLGKVTWGEAGRVESAEVAPAGLGPELG